MDSFLLKVDHKFEYSCLGVIIEFENLLHCRFCFTSSPINGNYNDLEEKLNGGNWLLKLGHETDGIFSTLISVLASASSSYTILQSTCCQI